MKKLLIFLLILGLLAFGFFYFREPVLDALPIDQSGWTEKDGNRMYLNERGDPLTGWQQLEGRTCYFSPEGIQHTGWLDEAGERYYFDKTGSLVTGWEIIAGNRHRFDDQGKLLHGFLEEDGKRFYLDENGSPESGFISDGETTYLLMDSGTIYSGWIQFAEGTYYLNENGAVHTGWLDMDGMRYYLQEDGTLYQGWLEEDGKRYYIQKNGTPYQGWVEEDDNRYYVQEDGIIHLGWLEDNGNRYYLQEDGTAHIGWLEEDGKRYYLREDGTPAVGKLLIDGEPYFFSSTGMNFIFVNPWYALPDDFTVETVQACGTWLDPQCQEALEKMLADCRAAGLTPQIISGYRSIADQRINFERMVESHGGNRESAAQVVAVPGTSEHHLGLAFDIVDSAYPKLNHQQATMPAQKWLMEHCWEYGFILRYPENTTDITGIIWEPWHYRYVGIEMALEIRDLGGITLEVYIDNLTNDGTTCGGQASD